jgi:hypothetical protein
MIRQMTRLVKKLFCRNAERSQSPVTLTNSSINTQLYKNAKGTVNNTMAIDPELKEMLDKVEFVKSCRAFNRWKSSFWPSLNPS